MEFRELIEYRMRNIFHEKSYTKCDREAFPRPFSKKSKLTISLNQHSKVLHIFFYCLPNWDYWKWLKLRCRPLAFTSYIAYSKNKKRSGTSLSALFSAWFLKKNISVVIFYHLADFQCLVVFTSWDIRQYVYCNCLLTRLRSQKL